MRVNDRLQVDDAGFAERLWSGTGLKGLVMGDNGFEGEGDEEKEKDGGLWGGEVLGLSSNIRVYRYGKGQFFGRHCEFHLLIDNGFIFFRYLIFCFSRIFLGFGFVGGRFCLFLFCFFSYLCLFCLYSCTMSSVCLFPDSHLIYLQMMKVITSCSHPMTLRTLFPPRRRGHFCSISLRQRRVVKVAKRCSIRKR